MSAPTLYFSNRCKYCHELFDLLRGLRKDPAAVFNLVCIDGTRPPADVDRVPMMRRGQALVSDEELYQAVQDMFQPQAFVPGARADEAFAFVSDADDGFDVQGLDNVYATAHVAADAAPQLTRAGRAGATNTKATSHDKSFDQYMQDRERDLRTIFAGQPTTAR